MRKTFKSLGDAYNFYNQYAYEHGFSVRKDSLKYSKGPEATKRLRKYVCARAGNDRQNVVQWKAGPAG